MRKIKHVVSLLLIAAVLCASIPMTYAVHDVSYLADAKKFSSSDVVFLDVYPVESIGVTVLGVEYENGDYLLAEYDGEGMTCSRFRRAVDKIETIRYYEEGRVVEQTEKQFGGVFSSVSNETRAGVETGTLGNIYYNYTDGGESGICSAQVSYAHREGTTSHDFNAQYRNVLELATWIVDIFNVPFKIANPVAAEIVSCISDGVSAAGDILFPELVLTCSYDYNMYTVRNNQNTSHTNRFGGTQYTFVSDDYSETRVDNTEDYFPLTAFSQQNYSFAATVYTSLFSYAYWNVRSWG